MAHLPPPEATMLASSILEPLTVGWVVFSLMVGFVIALLPKLDRVLSLLVAVTSAVYAGLLLTANAPLPLTLLDRFGVTLVADSLAAFFILTNAIVTLAVLCYSWQSPKKAFFYSQLLMLHGSLNAAFICADLVSIYIALEVSGIAAFLLIAYPRSDRSIWVALRYLFISNAAMLFYLVGAVSVYQHQHSFALAGLAKAPPEAIALIFLGLLVKGGVFISGLWLPLTHSESETSVSALLSGIAIKASILPLLRCALVSDDLDLIVRIFGVATALLGVSYAMFEKDTKRMLAFHTISQLGFVLAAPLVGGFYALTHGLVKSCLFLLAGSLPSRNFKVLKSQTIDRTLWVGLLLASLSISGLPLLAGFAAKALTLKELQPWQTMLMNAAAIGTAISFAKFIFLKPDGFPSFGKATSGDQGAGQVTAHALPQPEVAVMASAALAPSSLATQNLDFSGTSAAHLEPKAAATTPKFGLWIAVSLLLGSLVLANGFYGAAYTVDSASKAGLTIAAGWLIYWVVIRQSTVKLPQVAEEFDHLVGAMSLTSVVLFWMALSW